MGVYEGHEMTTSASILRAMKQEKEYRTDSRNAVGCECGICGEQIEAGEFAESRNGDWVHSYCLHDY